MAVLAKQEIDQNGLAPVYSAAAADQQAKAGEGVFLHVKNTNAAARDIVLNDPTTRDPGAATAFNPDVTVTIPALTGDVMIALPDRFGDADDGGLASWTWSATAGVTVAVLHI